MGKRIIWVLLMAASGAIAAPWKYETQTDPMTDEKIYHATIRSHNQLKLGFPYEGPNRGTLRIRSRPQDGTHVMVHIDRGQILCHFDDCIVTARFDDAPPLEFRAVGPADHSATVVFIDDVQRFVAEARAAKRILVSLPMYQAGSPILEFRIDQPLAWEHGDRKRVSVPSEPPSRLPEHYREYLDRMKEHATDGSRQ